jgi:hypothetical protein
MNKKSDKDRHIIVNQTPRFDRANLPRCPPRFSNCSSPLLCTYIHPYIDEPSMPNNSNSRVHNHNAHTIPRETPPYAFPACGFAGSGTPRLSGPNDNGRSWPASETCPHCWLDDVELTSSSFITTKLLSLSNMMMGTLKSQNSLMLHPTNTTGQPSHSHSKSKPTEPPKKEPPPSSQEPKTSRKAKERLTTADTSRTDSPARPRLSRQQQP